MGVREAINEKRGLTAVIISAIIVAAIGFGIYQVKSAKPVDRLEGKGGFFSDDDGVNWFEADDEKIPPWDHNGKQAVRAYVFSCDGGKTKYVMYLERYKPEAKQMLEQAKTGKPGTAAGLNTVALSNMIEVKLPKGKGQWVSRNDPRGKAITQIKCPDGKPCLPELMLPE
jgi:hypothetical protein